MTFFVNISRKLFLFLSLLTGSQSLLAAWSLEPSYYLRAERRDNIYLATPGNELAVSSGTFSPAIKAIMEAEDQSMVADVDLQFIRYKNHEELDRNEGKAGINWRLGTELSVYGIDSSYSKLSNLDSAIQTSGVDRKVETNTVSISPNWKYQVGERWSVAVNLTFTDVAYDEPGAVVGGLTVVNNINYVMPSGSLTLAHEITEKDSLSLTYYHSAYEGKTSDNALQYNRVYCSNFISCAADFFGEITVYEASKRTLESDYTVWKMGYEHQFESNSSLSMSAGSNNTTTHSQSIPNYYKQNIDQSYQLLPFSSLVVSDTTKKGQVYDIVYKYQSEVSRFELSAGRNRVASSTGGLNEIDTAKIYYFSGITERLTWSMYTNNEQYRPDQDTVAQLSPEYTILNVSPVISYSLSSNWSMSLGYRYSKKDIDTEEQKRNSSAVFFNMNWREPKLLSTN